MDNKLIFWLNELCKEDINQVGQKCASLAEMLRIGLPVPPGFVLSLQAFESFMKKTGAVEEISSYLLKSGETLNNLQQADEASRYIYNIIEKREIPKEIRNEVESSYKKLSERYGTEEIPVSVRSSGRESHPSLFDTYLNIRGNSGLISNIRSCWASVFSPRAIAMRAQGGVPAQIEPIAVAVQKMVQARSAGVLFTIEPISSDPSLVVIEASWGLGEGVAQAKVTPDKFMVGKKTLDIKERRIGQKTCQVVAIEHGTETKEVPQKEQSISCLSDKEIIELVKLAKLVELHYGGVPQDIEWAIDADLPFPKNIFLTQTRPVVMASPQTTRLNKPAGKSDADHIVDLLIERSQ